MKGFEAKILRSLSDNKFRGGTDVFVYLLSETGMLAMRPRTPEQRRLSGETLEKP